MGTFTLTDPKIWLDGHAVAGNLFSTTQEYSVDQVDDTVFGTAGTRSFAAGLKAHNFADAGYFESGTNEVDDIFFTRLGLTNVVRSVAPNGGTEGNAAYTTRLMIGRYNPFDGGSVGEMHSFTLQGQNKGDPLVRGTLVANQTISGTGGLTGFQVGAVAATETVYAALHVLNPVAFTSIDVTVESDATDAWIGAETTRLTFAQQTARDSDWQTAAGAITDTWWRVNVTGLVGTSADIAVVVGIL